MECRGNDPRGAKSRLGYSQSRLLSGLPLHVVLQCRVLKRSIARFLFGSRRLTRFGFSCHPLVRPGSSGQRGPDSRIAIGSGILPLLAALDFLCVLGKHLRSVFQLVGPSGIEPPTSCLSDRRSKPLSYGPMRGPRRRRRRRGREYCILTHAPCTHIFHRQGTFSSGASLP